MYIYDKSAKRSLPMSQQAQFEEFRDGPQPAVSYQGGYTGPQPTASYQGDDSVPQPAAYMVPPVQTYSSGQKLYVADMQGWRAPSVGARLALAIVSLVFLFVMYLTTMIIAVARISSPIAAVAILFAVGFSVVVLFINLMFNRRH
jgi:hypothetical protein